MMRKQLWDTHTKFSKLWDTSKIKNLDSLGLTMYNNKESEDIDRRRQTE